MRTIKKHIILGLALLGGIVAKAQDPHYSQYYSAPMFVNPAMTGAYNGMVRGSLHSRQQWNSIMTNPYVTHMATFNYRFSEKSKMKGLSTGALMLMDKAGAGAYRTFTFLLSASKDFKPFENKYHTFTPGMSIGLINKNVDLDRLFYGDQFDPWSVSFSNPTNEVIFGRKNALMPDINFGLLYYYGNSNSKVNPFIGGAWYHMTQPNESLFDDVERLPSRYVLQGGLKFNSEKVQFTAQTILMRQRGAQELIIGGLLHYKLEGYQNFLLMGVSSRLGDAIIPSLGLKHKNLIYRFSYDINNSSLQSFTSGQGAWEFSLVYQTSRIVDRKTINPCKSL